MAKRNVRQVFAYLATGVGTALFELVLFWCLSDLLGLAVSVANICAVVAATALNFIVNRSVTFNSTSNLVRSAVLYVLLFLFNLAFSTYVITALTGLGANPVITKAATQVLIAIWNFLLYRNVVFR